MNAHVERLGIFINRHTALLGAGGNCRNTCQNIFNAMVQLGNELSPALFSLLALSYVKGQAFDTNKTSGAVEISARCFFEPYHPAIIWALKAKAHSVGRISRIYRVYDRFVPRTVFRMNVGKETV